MSYPSYPPPATAAGPHAPPQPSAATYQYGAYQPLPSGYPQSPGAYGYQAGHYQAGVTGYGWPYSYGYVPQPAQPGAQVQRMPAATSAPVVSQQQPTSTPAAPQRTHTFASYTPTYVKESTASSGGGRGPRKQSNLKGLFTKDLKNLMYGFGDDRNPSSDTVSVMEEILIEYITDVCQAAGAPSRKARLSIEDLRRSLSRPADAKKLARMEELLFMQEDIKRARAQFEESDVHNPKEF